MLRKSRPPPSCFLIRSLESRYLSCPPQQGHPGIFSLLLTKNTVCLIANKRILCYNEHGFYQISEYATVQEGALRFFSFCRIMTVYRVTWRQATKSKKCYFKKASTLKGYSPVWTGIAITVFLTFIIIFFVYGFISDQRCGNAGFGISFVQWISAS